MCVLSIKVPIRENSGILFNDPHIYTYIYIYIYIYKYIYIWNFDLHEYVYEYMHTDIDIATHTHTHVYIYIYIYIYLLRVPHFFDDPHRRPEVLQMDWGLGKKVQVTLDYPNGPAIGWDWSCDMVMAAGREKLIISKCRRPRAVHK